MAVKTPRCKECKAQVPNELQILCNLCYTKDELAKEARNNSKLEDKELERFKSAIKTKL